MKDQIEPHNENDWDFSEDPIAKQVSWVKANKSMFSLGDRPLKRIGSARLEFKTEERKIIISLSVLALGIIFSFIFVPIDIESLAEGDEGGLFLLLSLLIVTVSAGTLNTLLIPKVFDKSVGYFWNSWRRPRRKRKLSPKKYALLSKAYAIQIISLANKNDDNKTFKISYEINLVNDDASRINVTLSSDYHKILGTAHIIAKFLDLPIWNRVFYLKKQKSKLISKNKS